MSQDEPLTVLSCRDGPVLVLELNAPRRRNALSLALRAELIEALSGAMADPDLRAIVLTGGGGHFCSGGDLSTMDGITAVSGRRRMADIHRLVRLILNGEKPVVAAVEGFAAGAGLSLAAACDIVVCARDAQFACSFNRVGLVPDLGASWILPLRMGLGRAKFIMLTGRRFGAQEAERWGLAELVCDPGQARAEAVAIAHELATVSPLSNGFTKALLSRMPRDLDEMLRAEADAQAILYASEDSAEGRRAFSEKRKPRFAGR